MTKFNKKLKYVQIGTGLIGLKRIKIIMDYFQDEIEILGYIDENVSLDSRLNKLNINQVSQLNPDLIIISLPHNEVIKTARKLYNLRSVVLIEKPIGRNLNESIEILNILDGCTVIGGYNYRFLPGVAKLFELIKNKSLGELKTVNMSLGHGGSPSDTSSWKLNPAKSGGGVILDPGIHLLDLVLNILQISKENINLKTLNVLTNKGFWNTGIEENALISFKTFNEAIFKINVSITEWKNKFEILAIGNDAQMIINGRGGNYGVHNYQIIPRWHWSEDKVNNEHVEFPDSDSMRYEIQAIVLFILNNFDSSKLVINKKNLELMKLYDTIKLNEK